MIPTIDERLASVVRALTDVVLPALPPEAGLALEQMQLSIGQLQIIRAQIDASPGFELEELVDARSLGDQLIAAVGSSEHARGLRDALALADASEPREVRSRRIEIHAAIDQLVAGAGSNPALGQIIIAAEKKRVVKERAWFAPFGFDIAPPTT